ncbi:MAG: beta-glucosidase family protein [Acidobacteriaceae bacterium]
MAASFSFWKSRIHTSAPWRRPVLSCIALLVMLLSSGSHLLFCAVQSEAAQARERAKRIVSQMTLAEKISQLHGIQDAQHYRIVPGIARLGIPPLRITNGPAGVGPGGAGPQPRATALPAPIALAATFAPQAARSYGRLAGEETKALGSDLLEAPDVNIVRVPQSGRTFEALGEDPWLTSRIAIAEIEGIQSVGVMANVKHFAANNQETQRGSINEIIGERALREIYLPAFKSAVKKAHVASAMCAYPRVNGMFNCANKPLLKGVLKGEWGFGGFVLSDFGAVHSTDATILAGLDLEMPTGKYFSSALRQAVLSGRVPIARIDDALVRRYTAMIEYGLFSHPPIPRAPSDTVPALWHGAVARRIAEESMVLLKNQGHLLPLHAETLKSVALVGPWATHATTGGGGSSYVNPLYTIRPQDGIYSHMMSQRSLLVLDGSNVDAAASAARKAQVAIVMAGDEESEGIDHSLFLPEQQDKLIAAVAAANPKTIVVLKTGSAVLMPWLDHVAAVLEAWYPGEEDGNAVADVLFGEADPGGRLPISFPARIEDTLARNPEQYPGLNDEVRYSEGLAVGYRGYQERHAKPLFPFGFGLSYTNFRYSDFSVSRIRNGSALEVAVRFRVTNTGTRRGSDVAQIYVGFPDIAEGNEAPLQLKGFQRVDLAAGETKTVRILLDQSSFSYWSEKHQQWQCAKGTFRIVLGASSENVLDSGTMDIP